ncbi:unnamed protein product [Peniophora sp. CBMAI 1063]|nr:unnamed protein product [Peniophora sp. CBMAI 1063]
MPTRPTSTLVLSTIGEDDAAQPPIVPAALLYALVLNMFSYKTLLLAISLSAHLVAAAPFGGIQRREVPQEHSHEAILIDIRKLMAISNPQNLGDPVFGLLGAAAAAAGLGQTTDANCLQQATADQAFTNAKASNDVAGMTSALIFRTLERNSGSVGGASPNCTSVTAVNPEIAALAQHQDPAGSGAQAFNKNLVLELAKQIASIGGTPTDALKSGTFAPGTIGDPTAKGNTCDDANDTAGCIVSQNLLVEDATEDEINAAVAGTSTSTDTSGDATDCPATATVTVTVGATATAAASTTTAAAAAATTTAAATSTNADIGNFGSCSVPQIEFGAGFDGRKETSFEPVDKTSFNHGSAQGIDIITKFICDTLTNSCGADATAKATCASAITAADGQTAKTGAQADAFNAVFGITTNFADTPAIDDQGNFVAGTGSATAIATGGIGNFGSCTTPQIEFATGFDNRKETSFQPVDKTSFNHGSAQNIDIITQFICDTLTNSCGADAQAKATCASAKAAADTKTAKTGAQADAFNAVFGITTNFAAVATVNDQGVTVSK